MQSWGLDVLNVSWAIMRKPQWAELNRVYNSPVRGGEPPDLTSSNFLTGQSAAGDYYSETSRMDGLSRSTGLSRIWR